MSSDVLASLGIAEEGGPPRIEAWNKIDLLAAEERERLIGEAARRDDVVPVSALTGEGLESLRQRMAERLKSGGARSTGSGYPRATAPGSPGCTRAAKCSTETLDKNEMHLSVRLSPDNWARFQALESA